MFLTVQYGTDANPGENQVAMREADVLCVPEFRVIVDRLGWNHILYIAMFCDPIGPYSKLPPETRDQRVTQSISMYPYKKYNTPSHMAGFYLEKKYFNAAQAAYTELVWNEQYGAFNGVRNVIQNISKKIASLNELHQKLDGSKGGQDEADGALLSAMQLAGELEKLMIARNRLEDIVFRSEKSKKGETIRTGLGGIMDGLKGKL